MTEAIGHAPTRIKRSWTASPSSTSYSDIRQRRQILAVRVCRLAKASLQVLAARPAIDSSSWSDNPKP